MRSIVLEVAHAQRAIEQCQKGKPNQETVQNVRSEFLLGIQEGFVMSVEQTSREDVSRNPR